MKKYLNVRGTIEYIFGGWNNIYIKLEKETKEMLIGKIITNWHGGNCFGKPEIGKNITIIKRNVASWEEVEPMVWEG